eukprot:357647-Chlamydomonas_euryale.AAC.2
MAAAFIHAVPSGLPTSTRLGSLKSIASRVFSDAKSPFSQNPKYFPPNLHSVLPSRITPSWPILALHPRLWDPICFAWGASSSNVDS